MEYMAWQDMPQEPALAALMGKGASKISRQVTGATTWCKISCVVSLGLACLEAVALEEAKAEPQKVLRTVEEYKQAKCYTG
jgi:hypothetical protein